MSSFLIPGKLQAGEMKGIAEANYDDLEFFEELGRGSFGVVYKGCWKGEIVAIKRFFGKFDEMEVSC